MASVPFSESVAVTGSGTIVIRASPGIGLRSFLTRVSAFAVDGGMRARLMAGATQRFGLFEQMMASGLLPSAVAISWPEDTPIELAYVVDEGATGYVNIEGLIQEVAPV